MFAIRLLSHDGEIHARGFIPFAPAPGIFLKAPWRNNDYCKVTDVYFDHILSRFEVHLDDAAEVA